MDPGDRKRIAMGKIYYLMGKSATGKDTIYKRLKAECPRLREIVIYTTRPKRDGETEGVEYHFTTEERLQEYKAQGKLIEWRTYRTVHGPWTYATVDDGQVRLDDGDYLAIGTLESYERLRDYYGGAAVVPLYVSVDDGIRLERALQRERLQTVPKYQELCRRFLADEEDFSRENLKRCGITDSYDNENLEDCVRQILDKIGKAGGAGK